MKRDRTPCVYLLASDYRGVLYTGVTSNLPGRIWQDREGVTGGFTSHYKVFRLVYIEVFDTMDEAIAREKQIKNWRRQWKINLIEAANPHWRDLASDLGFEPLPPRRGGHGP
ncbi:GIY-YIG nuclease family protein [Altererythrobacter sp. MF3-039]|uniref:GIY-YIG nuclease family protein n=1 Tax=Altererythrobacter sp. MF3-039 TaxID=3252901 RepID=UPI00390CCFF9